MKINASEVIKFEDGHFPRDPTAQDGVLFGLTNRFYHLICFWPIDLHFMYEIFFLPIMSLKNISTHSTIEKSVYPILLPYLEMTTLIFSRLSSFSKLRKSHLQKPIKATPFLSLHVLKQVFCFSWTKQLKKNRN